MSEKNIKQFRIFEILKIKIKAIRIIFYYFFLFASSSNLIEIDPMPRRQNTLNFACRDDVDGNVDGRICFFFRII